MNDEPTGRPLFGFGPDTVLFGIGNSGREDDGLGWAFLDRVERETEFPGRLKYRYQLQIEDAESVSRADGVLFVDSYQGDLPGGFQWKRCEPSAGIEFTSHQLPPGAILHLCRVLYGKLPPSQLLLIAGRSWHLRSGLSPEARLNLDHAVRFFRDQLPQF